MAKWPDIVRISCSATAWSSTYIDVSAARMLEELAADLQRDGVALVIARDIGQVRDVLRRARADAPLMQVHPTIQDAVDAVLTPAR
jgi:sulfate permease, SulP family